jgi:hypothetical protein
VDAAAVDAAVIRREAEQVEGRPIRAHGIRSRTASAMRFAELTSR